jgi:(S)-2-hydroxyglutarate dehydrogenase
VGGDSVTVIGAGLVGLAVAQRLALAGRSVVVIDKEPRVAAHQSGHNSGVVHAGLYYTPGSLKAQLCLEGRQMLQDYCRIKQIEFEQVGKLVMATSPDQLGRLDDIEARARLNGVPGLRRMGAHEMREIEPAASGLSALHSPFTAIVNFPAVAEALAADIRQAGGELRLGRRPTAIKEHAGRVDVDLDDGERVSASKLIACAGLGTDAIAQLLGRKGSVRIVPFRGTYWRLAPSARSIVRGLIYPVPDPRYPFLGIHLTRMIGGEVLVGPNAALALALEGYHRKVAGRDMVRLARWPGFWRMALLNWRAGLHESLGSPSRQRFADGARTLVPGLEQADLLPAWAGVRAQAVDRAGRLVDDFVVDSSDRVVLVRNAPSPAATSSLAIARVLADAVG